MRQITLTDDQYYLLLGTLDEAITDRRSVLGETITKGTVDDACEQDEQIRDCRALILLLEFPDLTIKTNATLPDGTIKVVNPDGMVAGIMTNIGEEET